MLTGILTPTSGRLRVAGFEPQRDRVRLARRIGVVFGQRTTLWWDLPLKDSFTLLRTALPDPARPLRREPRLLRRGARPRLLPRPAGAPAQPRPADARRHHRGAAARPGGGLPGRADDRTRRRLQARGARVPAADLNRRTGTTILLTTHDIDDIERLCSRVVAIDHGRVTYDGSLGALRADRDLETVVRELYLGRSLVDTTE
jgi:ABC-2 type transport system ATP-binding protein